MGDAKQRGQRKFILDGLLNLSVSLGVNAARGLVLRR